MDGFWYPLLVGGLVGVAAGLSGCNAPLPPAEIGLFATWQAWHDDPLPHLILTISNDGGEDASVGPGGRELSIEGPTGRMPVYWGDTEFARPVHGGRTVMVAFHPRTDETGTFGLAIDHAWGVPAPPPVGDYTVCIGRICTDAALLQVTS
ncbi:MAG: hypothetical protein HYT80_05170 [Euryarchaeota archaeon]|nr:hypothetical protein [Euryarchaeota archaeon]